MDRALIAGIFLLLSAAGFCEDQKTADPAGGMKVFISAIRAEIQSGDATKLAEMIEVWDVNLGPSLDKLDAQMVETITDSAAKLKDFEAKAADPARSQKTSEGYRRLAEKLKESIKKLNAARALPKAEKEQVEKLIGQAMAKEDVKILVEGQRAARKGKALLDEAARKLPKL